MQMVSSIKYDVWVSDISIKDALFFDYLNKWDLFIVVKDCIEQITLFGWPDSKRMVQQCTTE